MTLPYTFASLPAGNTPASYLDTNFSTLENMGIQHAVATGSANTYVLAPSVAWTTGYSGYKGFVLSVIFPSSNTSASTLNVSGLGAINIVKNVGGSLTALSSGDIVSGFPYLLVCDGTQFLLVPNATTSQAGIIGQAISFTTSLITITGQIPYDDTIPQNTEGGQILTVSYTPKNASSNLLVSTSFFATLPGSGDTRVAAMFRDSGANAIAATAVQGGINSPLPMTMSTTVASGSTSSTTFTVRLGAGSSSLTMYVNGASGGTRLFGGVSAAFLSVQEYI